MMEGERLRAPEEQQIRIEQEVEAIESSAAFLRSPVMRRLLRYVVDESIAGRGAQIKAYTLAVDGLGRGEDFDAQQDSYPRVQIGRLRKALESYYEANRPVSGLKLHLRPGSYEVHFVEMRRADDYPAPSIGGWLARVRRSIAALPRHVMVGSAVLAVTVALLVVLALVGAMRGWFSPWRIDAGNPMAQGRFVDLPVLDMRPIVPGDDTPQRAATANYLTFRITDAIRRSGWIRVRSSASEAAAANPTMRADYQLRGRSYRHGDQITLWFELVDMEQQLVIWTRIATLPGNLGSGDALNVLLGAMVNDIADVHGVIAERARQRFGGSQYVPGYPCLLISSDFRVQRSPDEFGKLRSCVKRTLARDPQSAGAWAAYAVLEKDKTDFGYAGDDQGSPRAAIESAEYATSLDAGDATARFALAYLHLREGNYARAKDNALRAVELNPYSPELRLKAGNILFFSGDRRGLDFVRQGLVIDSNPAPWFRQPLFFDAVMRGDKAGAMAEAAAMREPRGVGKVYLTAIRAVAMAMAGDREAARRFWSLVTAAEPEALKNPGLIFGRMGVSKPYVDLSVKLLRSAKALI